MQPDVARVLHTETDGLEVSWKGDRWRSFPQPEVAVEPPTPERGVRRSHTRGRYNGSWRWMVERQIAARGQATIVEVAKATGLSRRQVLAAMMYLLRAGVVEKQPTTRRDYLRRYRLTRREAA